MSDDTIPPFARGAINLASPRLGARVIFATDEFFAPKERLLKDEAPVFHPDAYDENGKWMDGWETRRRRGGGHDFCIVRLGAKGLFNGVDIATQHCTGNHPSAVSIDGALSDTDPDAETAWTELLPRRPLAPDGHNFFEIGTAEPFNFLRVNIFPDGGLARLRVFGSPVCEWLRQDPEGIHELSAVSNGGHVIAYNDAHYGDPWVILTPGRGANMGDGQVEHSRRTSFDILEEVLLE